MASLPLPSSPQIPSGDGPSKQAPPPRPELAGLQSLHLIMGMQCNVDCVMCYQTHRTARQNMPPAVYVEKLASVYPSLRAVKLQGGEPTVMRNCRDVARMLADVPQVRISLSTNGIRLDGFWREALLRQGGQIDVSLNAATEQTCAKVVLRGDFQRAVANVRALATARSAGLPRLGISMVILKENIRELGDFVRLGRDLGVDSVKFAIDPVLSFRGLPSPTEVVAELERVELVNRDSPLEITGLDGLRRRFGLPVAKQPAPAGHCRLPFDQAVIDHNGDVRGCVATWQVLGNLHRSSFEEIWNGPAAQQLRQRLAGSDYSRCEPWCPHNQRPASSALLLKYAACCTRNPGFFAEKLRHKVRQLRRRSA